MDKVSLSTIEYRDISSIIEYSDNAKIHSDNQIDQIANSIAEFSFLDPVSIDENNIILAGHGRLAAARKMGIEQIPVIQVKGLTNAQKKGYRLAHNKLTLNSSFDNDLLVQELQELNELDFDLSLTGFDTQELDSLLTSGDDFEFQGNQVFGDGDDESVVDDDTGGQPDSNVKMIQLFLRAETYPKFMEMIESLNVVYGTDNPTDCVMLALQADYERTQRVEQ